MQLSTDTHRRRLRLQRWRVLGDFFPPSSPSALAISAISRTQFSRLFSVAKVEHSCLFWRYEVPQGTQLQSAPLLLMIRQILASSLLLTAAAAHIRWPRIAKSMAASAPVFPASFGDRGAQKVLSVCCTSFEQKIVVWHHFFRSGWGANIICSDISEKHRTCDWASIEVTNPYESWLELQGDYPQKTPQFVRAHRYWYLTTGWFTAYLLHRTGRSAPDWIAHLQAVLYHIDLPELMNCLGHSISGSWLHLNPTPWAIHVISLFTSWIPHASRGLTHRTRFNPIGTNGLQQR